jgi:acetyl esterase/lipase
MSTQAGNPTDAIEPHILAKLAPDFVQYFVDVLSKIPPAQDVTIEQVRANPEKFRSAIALDSSGYERVKDYEVTSEDGARIPVRVYHPDPEKYGNGPYPVHLNFHGKTSSLGPHSHCTWLMAVLRRWLRTR